MAKKQFTRFDITQNDEFTEALNNSVKNQTEQKKEIENQGSKGEEKTEDQPEKVDEKSIVESNETPENEVKAEVAEKTEKDEKEKAPVENKRAEDKLKKKKMKFLRIMTEKKLNWDDTTNVRISRTSTAKLNELAKKLGESRNFSHILNNIINNFLEEYADVIESMRSIEEEKKVVEDEETIKRKELQNLFDKIF